MAKKKTKIQNWKVILLKKMKIHKNIGNFDRIIRIIVLVIFIYFGYKISPLFYLLALWELFVITTRWCFVYDILKINTSGKMKLSRRK